MQDCLDAHGVDKAVRMKNPLAFGIAFLFGVLVTLKPLSPAPDVPDDFAIRGGRTEAMIPFEYPTHEKGNCCDGQRSGTHISQVGEQSHCIFET